MLEIVCNTMQYMILWYSSEPVLIRQILISFEAILEIKIILTLKKGWISNAFLWKILKNWLKQTRKI